MSTRIRGQEYSAYLVVDGATLLGSFAKMDSFSAKPRADLTDSDFLGETESEPDLMNHGWDMSFTIDQLDDQAAVLWDNLVSQLDAGAILSRINIVVIKTFRDPSVPAATHVYQNCRLKLDDETSGSRKDYVKNSFSAKCKTRQKLS